MARRTDEVVSEAGGSRLRAILASRPTQLLGGTLLVLLLAWVAAGRLTVDQLALGGRAEGTDASSASLPPIDDQLIVVLAGDRLDDANVINGIERLTARVAGIEGVVRVASPTRSLALQRHSALEFGATPVFGSGSALAPQQTGRDRSVQAAASVLGSAQVVSQDGHTMAVIADLQPSLDGGEKARAAQAFTQAVDAELPASVNRGYAGTVFTSSAITGEVRSKSMLIIVVGLGLPALLTCVLFRRRVHPGFTLLVAGVAMLASGAIVLKNATPDRDALPSGHAVAQSNALADEQLSGSVPLIVRFKGAPGTFKQPASLARVDAMANYLRDTYGVHTVGLASAIRAEAANVSGVDSIPPNPADVDRLIQVTSGFDDGQFLPSLLSPDGAQTTLRGEMPSRSVSELATMMNRFLTIANAELAGSGITADIGTRVPDTDRGNELFAQQLMVQGALAIVVAAGLMGLAFVLGGRRSAFGWETEEAGDRYDDELLTDAARRALRDRDKGWQFPGANASSRSEAG